MPRTALVLICTLLAVSSAVSSRTAAQSAPSPRVAKLLVVLDSEAPASAVAAIDELSKLPVAIRVPLFAELLRQGQRDVVVEHLVLALGASRSDLALDPLRHATLHRLPSIRIAALQALSNFHERVDVAAQVATALRDSDPTVRGAAADALAAMNARTEVSTLLLAFARGVPEAAVAIGKLAPDNTLPAFTAFLGEKPIGHMLAGYQAWLARDDIRIDTKLAIVATLEEVAGVTVKRFLQALDDTNTIGRDPALRRAIAATIARIPEPQPNRSAAP